MTDLDDQSVHLVVTSPPYPMIAMWDDQLSHEDTAIQRALGAARGPEAFEAMHGLLDRVWKECFRVLSPGGILCVNIGDATRKLGGHFQLYANHARILSAALSLGFQSLPAVLWRKPTNAPNKFMGSGMLPGGAYVTLEHEYILILRKGGHRVFKSPEEKYNRRVSAYFWEERNKWFSDLWEIGGAKQILGSLPSGDSNASGASNHFSEGLLARSRSAAYPFEIPFRLISMFSVQGDTVLDPFWGIGTTSQAALALGRNSVGYELESSIGNYGLRTLEAAVPLLSDIPRGRLAAHSEFVRRRLDQGKTFSHHNEFYDIPVITAQERDLRFAQADRGVLDLNRGRFTTYYRQPAPITSLRTQRIR